MSAPPSGLAPRPAACTFAARSRYRTLALAATLLPCAALPLQAATTHAPPHRAGAAHSAAVLHTRAVVATSAHTPLGHPASTPKHHAEIARAEVAEATRSQGSRNKQHGPKSANKPAAHMSPREALAAKAAAFRNEPVRVASAKPATTAAKPADTAAKPTEDTLADQAVQDRVHAWMRTRGTETAAKLRTADHAASEPDLSPNPRKATVEDFDRAAQRQTQTLRATAAQNQARTTTADDDAAALAESHIPSTAPTARIPTPFTHGDLLGSATSADFTQRPATLTTKSPDAAALKKPDPRTDSAALATTASAADAGVKPASLRILSAQTASSATPELQLPRPAPIVRAATAATAIAAAAKHPVLDPQVAAAMSDETFDDDAPTPTAATAIALSGKSAKTDLRLKPALADDDPDTRSTGAIAKVDLYDSRGRLRLIPAMKGTHEILVHQNQMAVADGLDRIDDDDQLYDMRRLKLLVALPDNDAIEVNEALPANRRYARPWSVRFLNDLSRAHYARFHTPLIITSAVRTVAFQRRLVMTNGNAAPPTGDIASPHLYGQAVDLGKRGMSITEIAWMRAYLTPVEDAGKIDVEEEFQQACFHISVYRRYLGLPARKATPKPDVAAARTLLQAKATPAAPAKHRRLPSALLATGLR